MTTEAQSVNGIKPIRITSPEPTAPVALEGALVGSPAQFASQGVVAAAKVNLRKSLRFMLSSSPVFD
jgi:hypothetical protein